MGVMGAMTPWVLAYRGIRRVGPTGPPQIDQLRGRTPKACVRGYNLVLDGTGFYRAHCRSPCMNAGPAPWVWVGVGAHYHT